MPAGSVLAEAEARYVAANPESCRLHEQRARFMPGRNTRTTIHQPPFPLTIVRGEGARIVTLTGTSTSTFSASTPRGCTAIRIR